MKWMKYYNAALETLWQKYQVDSPYFLPEAMEMEARMIADEAMLADKLGSVSQCDLVYVGKQ